MALDGVGYTLCLFRKSVSSFAMMLSLKIKIQGFLWDMFFLECDHEGIILISVKVFQKQTVTPQTTVAPSHNIYIIKNKFFLQFIELINTTQKY